SVLDKVKLLFDDPNPSVRISSAEAIFIHRGFDDEAMKLILEELNSADMENKLHAVSTLEKVNINDAMDYLPELIGIYQKYGNKNDGYSSSFMKHILWQLITQLELDKY